MTSRARHNGPLIEQEARRDVLVPSLYGLPVA
jgi:hypothetical protein